jgi:ribosomal protein S18 acetylase RimI-like enzyme
MQFLPFQKEHLSTAAALLARQAGFFLKQFPLLPDRINDPDAALSFLTALLEKEESRGAVAMQDGKMVAYLLGAYADNIFFGRHVWVPFGGLALDDQENTEVIRQVYAEAGQQWINDRVLNHYLVCPAIPAWLQAGYSLTFGQEQSYAITTVKEPRPPLAPPAGIVLRQVLPSDADQLYANGHWIAAHLNKAPVWEPVPQQHLDNILPEYAKLADDPTSITWVAVDGDQIVSYVVIYTVDTGPEHLLGESSAAHFSAAATHPHYRNRGIGKALFTHILNVAQQQGYHTMFTDWRTTNLTAAKYWPGYGFEPFAYRLLRRVNPIYEPFPEK